MIDRVRDKEAEEEMVGFATSRRTWYFSMYGLHHKHAGDNWISDFLLKHTYRSKGFCPICSDNKISQCRCYVIADGLRGG